MGSNDLPSSSTMLMCCGLQQNCESFGIFTDPSHQCGPTGGPPGKTEKEESWSGAEFLLLSGLTALVQRSWHAYPGKVLPIACRPDHRAHLGLTSIGELNHVVLCGSRAWFDLDPPIFQRLLQFQTQHRFRLCFEPRPQAPRAIDFQEVKAVQVPEEAFAQQRERDKVQRMSSSQRHWVRVSQFRRGMRTGIACSYHQDGTWRNLGRIAVGGRVKLLDLWRERRGKCRNAWVVKWPCCHDDGGRLIGALGGLQNERLRTLLHVHNSRVRLDGKCKVVGIGLEVVGKFTEGWTDFALKGGNLH